MFLNFGKWEYFKKSKSAIFSVDSLFSGCQLLKKRICSSRSKFCPLIVDSILEGFCPWKQTESNKSYFPLYNGSKTWVCKHP